MNKKTVLIPSAVVLTAFTVYWQKLHFDLYAAFPDIDRKIVRRAYNSLMWKSFAGKLPEDLQDYDDIQMMDLFLREVRLVTQ